MRNARPSWAVLVALLFCLTWVSASGQSGSATISGAVVDKSGSAVAGATVKISNDGTDLKRQVVADGAGRYSLLSLPVGTYSITVSFPSFRETELKGVVLETQSSRELNFTLVPATVNETVEVQGVAVQIERTDASLGQVIHAQQVSELPLNGRDFVQLGTLAPGVTKGEAAFFNNRGISEVSIRGGISLSIQGMRENANDWLLDGIDNNELTSGAVSILPSIDSIQEFKVMAFNYSAEYGSRGGATILVTTKSGTNQLHGSAFEFLRNDVLDARNYFDGPKKGKYIQNQFGGTVGGPIRKDKTFFFGSYQGEQIRQGLTVLSTVPTALMRQGNFSESFPGFPEHIIYDPRSTTTVGGVKTRTAFANNTITTIDPIGQALVNLFPLPNVAGVLSGNYLSNPLKTFGDNAFSARIDHTFGPKDNLGVRFSYDDASQFYPSGLPGFGSGGQTPGTSSNTNFTTNARNISISETHIFSPQTVNTLTIGYNRVFNRFQVYGYGTNESAMLGIPGANLGDQITSGLSNFSLSGGFNALGARTFSPFQGGTNIYQYGDSLLHTHGAHTMHFGFNMRANQMNTLGNTSAPGSFSFDNNWTAQLTPTGSFDSTTGLSIASLLLGLPASGVRSNQFQGWVIGRRWKEYRGFFQDDWRITQDLTLNLGVAYAVTTPFVEAHDRQANFDPSTNTLLIPGQNAGRSAGVKVDWQDVSPRIGFAWSPRNNPKTVIRGGYGMFYDVSAVGGVQGLYQNPPAAADSSYTADDINIVHTLETGFPVLTAPPTLATYTGNLVIEQKDFKQGRIQQWNLNIQRQLPSSTVLTMAYVGTRGTDIQDKGINTNTATPGPGVNLAARRPFPQYNNFNAILSRGLLRYDALQIHAEKQTTHGLYFLASYTWAKAFTNGLSQNVGTAKGILYFPLNIFPKEDKGLSDTDLANSFSFSTVYKLPFGKDKASFSHSNGIVEGIVSGWEVGIIQRIRSGFPLFFSLSSNQSGTAVGSRPLINCNATLAKSQRSAAKFFNTSCFSAPPSGTLAVTPRSAFFGPGQANTDFSLTRSISLSRLRDGADLQFRAEIFNIFNQAEMDQPGAVFGNANFSTIIDTVNSSRQIQFALKARF